MKRVASVSLMLNTAHQMGNNIISCNNNNDDNNNNNNNNNNDDNNGDDVILMINDSHHDHYDDDDDLQHDYDQGYNYGDLVLDIENDVNHLCEGDKM